MKDNAKNPCKKENQKCETSSSWLHMDSYAKRFQFIHWQINLDE